MCRTGKNSEKPINPVSVPGMCILDCLNKIRGRAKTEKTAPCSRYRNCINVPVPTSKIVMDLTCMAVMFLTFVTLNPGTRTRIRDHLASSRTRSLAFSPIMIAGAFVFPLVIWGMMDASATRSPSTPTTRSFGSTTAIASVPILQVPVGW